jgi:hypothetical protein
MDIIMIKFSDLKNEILQSLTNINRLIKLTEELYNSCDKYSKVKELFWKVNLNIFGFTKKYFLRIRIYLYTMLHNFILVLKLY